MKYCFLFSLMFFAGAAGAQTVSVRGGEHPTFTRLVITMPVGTDWQVGRISGGYGVRLPDTNGIEIPDLFVRIPRSRIIDANSGTRSDQLDLTIDCECNIDAFLWQPGRLVVDVRDGMPSEELQFLSPAQGVEAITESTDSELVLPIDVHIESLAVLNTAQTEEPPLDREITTPRNMTYTDVNEQILPTLLSAADTNLEMETDLNLASLPASFENIEGYSSTISHLELELVESIARAASQGLLDPIEFGVAAERQFESDQVDLVSEVENAENISMDTQSNHTDLSAPGFRSQTSIDRDSLPWNEATILTQVGDICLPNEYFDIYSWGDERPFGDQISELRSKITGEFDHVNGVAVENLARAYIYFGFGREAALTLTIDEVLSQERLILAAIGDVIDNDSTENRTFDGQIGCDATVALWAFLAHQDGPLGAEPNRNIILQSFNALPVPLQVHLSARLSDRFLGIGDVDSAQRALSIGLTMEDRPVAIDIAVTAVSLENGHAAEATEQLIEIADSDSRLTPEALLRLLLLNISEGSDVDPIHLELAGAIRFENSNLPIVGDLAEAHIKLLIRLGELDAAFSLIDEEARSLGEGRVDLLYDSTVFAAASLLNDIDFLNLAFSVQSPKLGGQSQNLYSRRLLDLGFPERARALIVTDADGVNAIERQYLRAEVAIARDLPFEVDRILANIATERANMLRSQARISAGDYAGALEVGVMSDNPGRQASAAWRSGNWQILSQSQEPVLQAASLIALGEDGRVIDPDAQLLNGRMLLTQSEETRNMVIDLLSHFVIPE